MDVEIFRRALSGSDEETVDQSTLNLLLSIDVEVALDAARHDDAPPDTQRCPES